MSLTTYGANALLNASADWPSPLYLQLHSGPPGDAAVDNVSPTTDRQPMTPATATDGTITNSADVAWSSTDPGGESLAWLSGWDAASGGNPWVTIPLDSIIVTASGQGVVILAGNLIIDATAT